MDRKEPTPHGPDTLGRPSRPTGPAAGAVPQGRWSEPGQAASATMQNVSGAMEATGERRAGTQSRRGSPAKQRGSATQGTTLRQSYRRLAGTIPLLVRDHRHGLAATTREKQTARQETQKHSHAEPRSGRPTKQTPHSAKAEGTRGRKPEKARDNGGAQLTRQKEHKAGGGVERKTKRQGPRHPGPETIESKKRRRRTKGTTQKKKRGKHRKRKGATPGREGAKQKDKMAEDKVRCTTARLGGRPARLSQEKRAHTHTHGTRAWRSPTWKGGLSASTRNSPDAPAESSDE